MLRKPKFKKNEKTEPKEAVALKYDPEIQSAPVVVAAGTGEIAEKIVETAKENNVPVHKDPSLARTLNKLNLGDQIPQELYGVVAEILFFIGELDEKYGVKNESEKEHT